MKRLSEQTLYEILEVPPDAPAAEIEAAYVRAHDLYAPGSLATYALMSAEEAAMLTSRIEEAKSTLLDAAARARYDEDLARAPQQPDGAAGAPGPVPPAAAAAHLLPALALAPDDGDDEEAEPPRPAILLSTAVRSADAPQAGSRPPIKLEREISGPPVSTAPRAAEPPPVDVEEWTGDALRSARESRGVTIQQIADRTKVTRHHIENIEGERFGSLPAAVYLRGILLSMARELRLDGQKVARSYLARVAASGPPPAGPKPH